MFTREAIPDDGQMEIYAARVARRVRAYQRGRGLSQQALAEMADISLQNLQALERGNWLPTLRTLVKTAHALGDRPAQLLEDGEAEAAPDANSQT